MEDISIQHDARQHRFEAKVDGHACVLEYRMQAGRMLITHTGVPAAVGGRGIAGRLVQAALDWARAQGLRVVAQCSYAASFVARHPQYADLVDPA
jgi:predicted GNAT family acetyltransferase